MNIFVHFLAPARFRGDQDRYLAAFSKPYSVLAPDEQYITNFYNFFLYNHLGLLGSVLLTNILLLIYIDRFLLDKVKLFRIEEIILLNAAFIFLSFMNKEIVAIFLLTYLVFSKHKIFFKVFVLSIYPYVSGRLYWFIFLIMFVFNKILSFTNKYTIILATITMILIGNIIFNILFDYFLLEQRTMTLESLWYHNPRPINTEIVWYEMFNNAHINSIANYLYAILTVMVFPFIYFTEFKMHLILFYLMIYYTIYYYFFIKHDFCKYSEQNIVILFPTFIFTLLIFEPDLGSFARHLAPIFIILAIDQSRRFER